jgi:hypothetical protein
LCAAAPQEDRMKCCDRFYSAHCASPSRSSRFSCYSGGLE